MKKQLQHFMAALALLVFMVPAMVGWGQTTSTTNASKVTSSSFTWTSTDGNVSWSGTVNGGATNQNIYSSYAQIGTGSSPSTSVILSTSSVSGTITSVVINCAAYQGKATVSATVGGSAFGTQSQSCPSWSSNSGGDVTFSGSASGSIVVTMTNGTGGRAMYIKSIAVTYTSGGTTTYVLSSAVTPTGTGTVSLSKTLLEEGETATATATANAHYNFTSWSIAGGGATLSSTTSNPTTVTMGTANATITATFTEDPKYNITYNANYAGSTDEPVVVSNYAGEAMTIADYSTFSRTGYAITNWNTQADGSGTTYNAGDSYTMTSAGLTLYAQWEVSYETVDVLNREFTGITGGSGYGNWSGKEGASGAVYAGNSAGGASTSNPSIQLRTSGNNSGIVSTTSGGKVTKVEVTWNSSTLSGRKLDIYGKNSAYSAATDLYGNNAGTLIGSITCGNNNPTVLTISDNYEYIGMRSDNNAIYLDEIKITWLATPSTDPTITTDDVEIAYNATGGSVAYTINNEPTPAGTLTASTTAQWLTLGTVTSEAVPFTCTANENTTERTATVTLTYTYGDNETVTKDVTVTQAAVPLIYSTIPAIFNAATATSTNVNVTFGNWVVSGANGSNVFVTDNNGNGFMIYKSNNGFAVNDKLSGTVMGTPLMLFNGSAEFTNLTTTTDGLSVSHDGAITVITDKTIADLVGVNTGAVITLSNLTYDGTNLSDGTNTIKPYTTLYAGTFVNGKVYNVTGVYQQYSSTKEILPRSAADIVEVVSAEPSVTVTPNTINAPAAGADGSLALTYENIEDFTSFDYYFCDATGNELEDTDPNYPDWILAEIQEGNNVYTINYIIDANNSAARTAYIKVYTFDDNLEEVGTIVTVNQEEYVIDYATLPFEWEGGASADFLALNGVTAHSLGSDYAAGNAPYFIKLDATGDYIQVKCDQQPGKVTIGVKMIGGANTSTITVQGSADGETFTDVEELTISGTQNDVLTLETTNSFATTDRYVRMLFTKGSNVGVGPITIAVVNNTPSITVTPSTVNVDANEHDGTIDLTYENLTITEMTDFDIQFCDANGDELSEEPDWIEVVVAEQDPEIGEGYVVSYYMLENDGAERTAYFKVFALGEEDFVYSNLVTVTQEAMPAQYTVYFYEGTGDCDVVSLTGSSITLPTATISSTDWTFAGWATAPTNETNQSPTLYTAGSTFTPEQDINLYAVYTQTQSSGGSAVYQKVTSAPTDWSGEYLIVYEEGGLAFDGSLTTLDASHNTIDITINNNTIEASQTNHASSFTVAPITQGVTYTIQSASGLYIGKPSDGNGMDVGNTQYINSLSFNDGSVHVVSSGSSHIRYNATSGQERFRYFKSTTYTAQKAIQFYKLTSTTTTTTVYNSFPTIATTQLDVTEGFEGYSEEVDHTRTNVKPTGWTVVTQYEPIAQSKIGRPQVYNKPPYSHDGTYCLIMDTLSLLAMPKLQDGIVVSQIQMELYVRQSWDVHALEIGVMSDLTDPSSYVSIAIIDNEGNAVNKKIIDFSNYDDNLGGRYIVFKNFYQELSYGIKSFNYIDDIKIVEYVESTCGITDLSEAVWGFEADEANTATIEDCWTLVNKDKYNDSQYNPSLISNANHANTGQTSLKLDGECLYAMPEFKVPNKTLSDVQMEFYVKQYSANCKLRVGVMKDVNNPGSFKEVAVISNDGASGSLRYVIDFSDPAYDVTPEYKYIAFRNFYNGSWGRSINYIDDIVLSELVESTCGITDLSNAEWGFEPDEANTETVEDCWTLSKRDKYRDHQYDPSLISNANHANTGQTSLKLDGECLYAMPEFKIPNKTLSDVQMEFYVKQYSANCKLRVGVMTDVNDPSTFKEVAVISNEGASGSQRYVIDFGDPAYEVTSEYKYIAFRNFYNGVWGRSINYIDDIVLSEPVESTCGITDLSNAVWGFEPDEANTATIEDCWTLSRRDKYNDPQYDPSLISNANHANTGQTSLKLDGECLYAMPEFKVPNKTLSDIQMEFYVKQYSANCKLRVGVMTDVNNPATFKEVAVISNDGAPGSQRFVINFGNPDYEITSDYKYIAFRNFYNGVWGRSINYIDDIVLSEPVESTCGITDLSNAVWGFEPDEANTATIEDCWTLSRRDKYNDPQYDPSLISNANHANTGQTSLKLDGECLYAMPEFKVPNKTLSDVQMEFYVKQYSANCKLRVGVMTDVNNPATFKEVAVISNDGVSGSHVFVINFSNPDYEITGEYKYIAFRNFYNGTWGRSINYIDDITLSLISNENTGDETEMAQTSSDNSENIEFDSNNENSEEPFNAPNAISNFSEAQLSLYPNPTSGKVTLVADEVTMVEVYSQIGSKVASFTMNNERVIDLGNLPKGVYILRVTMPQGIAIRKVVKN